VRIRRLTLLGLIAVLGCAAGLVAPAIGGARPAKTRPACLKILRTQPPSDKRHAKRARRLAREKRRCRRALRRAQKSAAARARQREASARPSKQPVSAPAVAPSLVWNGDLSTGTVSQYSWVQDCAGSNPPKGVTIVNSPVRPGYTHSSMFTVSDSSVSANCPTLGSAGHPNSNLQSPGLFKPGTNDYIGFSTDFPFSFPNNVCLPWKPMCWMQIMEIYGQPYAGIPPIAMYVIGNRLTLGETPTPIWTAHTPIVKNAWQDVVLRVNFSTNPAVGYVQLWLNGVPQTFINHSTRYDEATLKSGNDWDGVHANRLYLDQYRGPNPRMGTVTLYHSAAKVAQTYAQAAP
jgi:hypothetical protein